MYTYKATVSRVVDGDTIYVDVDLGFYLRQLMRLRLNGVNTPELRGETRAEGLRAKQFVEQTLAGCPAVVIQTTKMGKYGRYIADVWYLPGSDDEREILGQGQNLCQVLLAEGLAEPMSY
jgi:micrococcal nuclease